MTALEMATSKIGPRRLFLAMTLLFIAVATLVPTDGFSPPFSVCFVCGIHGGADAVVNVLLFMPLGAALALNDRSGWRFVCLAALLSASIELTQFVIPGRDPSIGDVTFNTLGAAVGQCLVYSKASWSRPDARTAARFSLCASVAAVLTFALTGWLFTPDLPHTDYHAWWRAEGPEMERVRGRFLGGAVGTIPLAVRNGPLPAEARALLAGGAPLRIEATAGPPPATLLPLFAIRDDHHHEILLLAPDRTDFVLRYRLNAARLRLDQPDLRLHAVLRGLGRNDTLHLSARRAGSRNCLRVNRAASCELGFTLGEGWALLFYPRHVPPWFGSLLDGVWLAGLTIPVGFWARRRWESGLAALLLAAGLSGVPLLTGLVATPRAEFLVAAAGWIAGGWLRRLLPATGIPVPAPGS